MTPRRDCYVRVHIRIHVEQEREREREREREACKYRYAEDQESLGRAMAWVQRPLPGLFHSPLATTMPSSSESYSEREPLVYLSAKRLVRNGTRYIIISRRGPTVFCITTPLYPMVLGCLRYIASRRHCAIRVLSSASLRSSQSVKRVLFDNKGVWEGWMIGGSSNLVAF